MSMIKDYKLWLFYLLLATSLHGQNAVLDIRYATVDNRDLKLDLYMPDQSLSPCLIVWVHGGAWHSGSKANPPMDLLKKGYALASIDYRTTVEAKFPSFIHDIKAAVRFLRSHAAQFKFNGEKIILWGSSAGGHLVALAGMSNEVNEMEGNVGNDLNTSSRVQGIIDFYGPSNLSTIMNQSTPHGAGVRGPALALMFGKPLDQSKEDLVKASPVTYVTKDDPPLFICHGDQDIQVPINQSIELFGKYKETGLPVQLEFVFGAGHGGKQYNDPGLIDKVESFIKSILDK